MTIPELVMCVPFGIALTCDNRTDTPLGSKVTSDGRGLRPRQLLVPALRAVNQLIIIKLDIFDIQLHVHLTVPLILLNLVGQVKIFA